MAEDFLIDFSADEVNSLLYKIQESSVFTAEEKQKLSSAINSSGVAYKALADGNGSNIPNTYQTKFSADNKLNPEFINYDDMHRMVSDTEKTLWNTVVDNEEGDRETLVEIANSGPKNEFQITETPQSPIVIVDVLDGTVEVNGNTGGSNLSYTMGSFTPVLGKHYILTGCPSGGSSATYRIVLSGIGYDYGDGLEFEGDGQPHSVGIWVKSGQTVDLDFYPMICLAAVWAISHEFQPYRPSYQELYEMVLALQGGNNFSSIQANLQFQSGNDNSVHSVSWLDEMG